MAKLSAHGRTCQAEVSRIYTTIELQARHDRAYPDDHQPSLTTAERVTRRLMSDGKILEKRDVTFRMSAYEREPQRHTYSWTVRATLKAGKTVDDWTAGYLKPRSDGSPSPWIVGAGGPIARPKVRLRTVIRALESGDESTGFCTACGAQAFGVEPDARGYTCESCQAPQVYGAEELLLMLAL